MPKKPKPKRSPESSVCVFSEDRQYRYRLEHRFEEERDLPSYVPRKTAVWIMLNPSIAFEDALDPTLRRCKGFSRAAACTGMIVVNLFALVSTDPTGLYSYGDPIGPFNDEHILSAVNREDVHVTICGWGNRGSYFGRANQVMGLLAGQLSALKINKDGSCAHPLYLSSKLTPQPYPPVFSGLS